MAFDWKSLKGSMGGGAQSPDRLRTGYYDPRPYPVKQAEAEERRKKYQAYLDAGGYDISGTTYTMDADGNYVFPSGVYDRKSMKWISGGPPQDPRQNTWAGNQDRREQPPPPPTQQPPADWLTTRMAKHSYPTTYQRQRMPRWFGRTLGRARRTFGGSRGLFGQNR